MEVPESIKKHAIRVAKGYDSFTDAHRLKDFLNNQRQEILESIERYKEAKRSFLEATKRQEEAKQWCEANGIEIEEETTERE